jgi:hypothetical protein
MVSFQGDAKVFSRFGSVMSTGRRWVALVPLLFAVACNQPRTPASIIQPTNEWHTFEGTWSASGTRQTLNLELNHHASIFDLTGSLLLTGDQGIGVGFQAKAIGMSDTLEGMQGRCVWTDQRGNQLYSELKGEYVAAGKQIEGTFVGGTGRFAGVTGDYSFQWQYVVDSDDGTVSGRAVDLKGRARLGSVAASHGGAQGQ